MDSDSRTDSKVGSKMADAVSRMTATTTTTTNFTTDGKNLVATIHCWQTELLMNLYYQSYYYVAVSWSCSCYGLAITTDLDSATVDFNHFTDC